MPLLKFESMLKTNSVYFFDLADFEEIIIHYLEIGKHTLAKKAVELGLEQHPDSIDLKLFKVELYVFENKLDKASALLKKIEKLSPNNEEVFIQKASICSKKGNPYRAIAYFKKALNFTSEKTEIWALLGMEYLYLNDYKNARYNFIKCIEFDEKDYSALYNIAYCFDSEKKHKEAISFLKSRVNINPYCEISWHQLGKQQFTLEQYDEALTSFDYALLIDEDFIGGYLEKAKTLEKLGKHKEALNNYLITLKLDDPSAYVFFRIGKCNEKLGNFKKAISYYKKAIHEDPLSDKGWGLLARLYFKIKNYKKSLDCISKAVKMTEDKFSYWKLYSEVSFSLNLYQEAVFGLKKCLTLDNNSIETYISLSDLLYFLGDINQSIKFLIKAKKRYKDFAEIEYRLAGLFLLLNSKKLGFYHLARAVEINYRYISIFKKLYPSVYNDKKVQAILISLKKRLSLNDEKKS